MHVGIPGKYPKDMLHTELHAFCALLLHAGFVTKASMHTVYGDILLRRTNTWVKMP